MRVTVLGTGDVGRHLAARLVESGHEVTIGTRDPDATRARPGDGGRAPFAAWLDEHPGVTLDAYGRAATGAELVVNASAGAVSLDVVGAIDPDDLAGVVLLDVSNPLDFSAGFPPTLSIVNDDSLAERLQRAVPAARVVKSLNTIGHELMVAPHLLDGPHEVFVAGEDPAAKQVVTDLLVSFGWPSASIVDLGGLRAARATEMYLPLWLALMQTLGTTTFNLHVVRGEDRRTGPGSSAGGGAP